MIKALIKKSLRNKSTAKRLDISKSESSLQKGDTSDPANYRPISLTCILFKVMEHIVTSNLAQHLNKNDIVYGLQHGFREERSCKTQLISWGTRQKTFQWSPSRFGLARF